MATLTAIKGNPAQRIADQYESLMAITDLAELRAAALAVLAGGGISPTNATRFRHTVARENTVARLQSFLTNFMLKADGLGVI